MNLFFVNFTGCEISQSFFKKILKKIIEKKLIPSEFLTDENKISIEVVLLGEGRMRSVNKRYAGKNRITDVLSFSESEIKKPAKKDLVFIEPPEAEKILGEILLCPSRIKKNAKKFKKDFKEEIAFDFIHGFLHLLGYGHKGTQDAKKMEGMEKKIMKTL